MHILCKVAMTASTNITSAQNFSRQPEINLKHQ